MKHLLLTTIAALVLVGCRPEPPKISIGDAAGNGNIEAVKQHIAAGTDVNASTRRNGVSAVKALSIAAASGHKEITELLIANGADVNEKSLFSLTPLRGAAQKGHLEMMELLIAKGADLNEDLLLHGVARSGQEKAVEFLISKGLNANVRDSGGATPLHMASIGETIGKDTTQVVELLIGRGANVNAKDNIGYTPMDYTASTYSYWQRFPEKKVESKRKASLLSKHGGNYSSINFAVVAGDIEAVRKFLEAGADVNWMPSSVAFNMHLQPPFGFAKKLKHTEIMELLRKHGGKTRNELRTAARRVEAAKNSIHVAATTGNIEAVKQHLAAGADVNAKTSRGKTPLHYAAQQGHKKIAELLIAKGADVNAKDSFDATPLDSAIANDRTETADLLRKHGGKTGAELIAEEK